MALDEKRYHKLFVDSKLVSEEDFAKALDEAKKSNQLLESALVSLGLLSNEEVGKVMSKAYDVPFVDLLDTQIDPAAMKMVPEVAIRKQMALPYGFKDGTILVAAVDPDNIEAMDFIEKQSGMQVAISYVTPDIFEDTLRSNSADIINEILGLSQDFEKKYAESGSVKIAAGGKNYSVDITDRILQYAYADNASDIHIEPSEKMGLVRFRIDGVLHDVVRLSKALIDLIVSRIKIMSALRTDEHFTAQDGKFRVGFGSKSVDVRVSIMPVVEGEKLVMRLLSEKGHTYTLNTLGLRDDDFKKIEMAAKKPYGMILSTGPTGSGKTTMMYTVMKILNTRDVNIQTIEDPIEYELEGVNQIQVNPLANITFASGLRSIVRQDPDIIMVGEIRDAETAGISVSAAMTGHLVLSTLHTNNAATAVPRLLDFNVEPFLIASSINIIIAQRLVRHVCRHCAESGIVDMSKFKESIPEAMYKKYFGKNSSPKMSRSKGCSFCNKTGFEGRIGIFEVLVVSEGIRELIMQRVNADIINNKAIEEGMVTMLEDGIIKAIDGLTTIEEVLRNTAII